MIASLGGKISQAEEKEKKFKNIIKNVKKELTQAKEKVLNILKFEGTCLDQQQHNGREGGGHVLFFEIHLGCGGDYGNNDAKKRKKIIYFWIYSLIFPLYLPFPGYFTHTLTGNYTLPPKKPTFSRRWRPVEEEAQSLPAPTFPVIFSDQCTHE